MTAQYLILAVVLAFTLNHANPFVRAGGTLLAAVGLAFIVLSIVLADLDGNFAAGVPRVVVGLTRCIRRCSAGFTRCRTGRTAGWKCGALTARS